jgi:hypothetical protein
MGREGPLRHANQVGERLFQARMMGVAALGAFALALLCPLQQRERQVLHRTQFLSDIWPRLASPSFPLPNAATSNPSF